MKFLYFDRKLRRGDFGSRNIAVARQGTAPQLERSALMTNEFQGPHARPSLVKMSGW